MLAELVEKVRQSAGIRHKQDIQWAAKYVGDREFVLGDDCAAIADGNDYLLLAAEGMLPQFVRDEPWFAGWCGVMVNVSDICAMGGKAIAIVDTLWSQTPEASTPVWEGMRAAAAAYNVPIVGGHTNCHSPHAGLSVAILGRATHLMSSFTARPGDRLLMAVDLNGQQFPNAPFWNAATEADPVRLRKQLTILPELASSGTCRTGKDISNGGVLGTALMLLEASRVGADIEVDRIPKPEAIAIADWVQWFPSYGFLLSVSPDLVGEIRDRFHRQEISCEAIGTVTVARQVHLRSSDESALLWNFDREALTGCAGAFAS
ncbi:MAG: sll0787 family AIR synthase-like protein [Cyanobacteria bacterium J06639_1]